jgi:hypothetical protein
MKARRPSPALVISIIALVAACAGTAVAATVITTKQIKNGTIQNIDVKKGTLQSSRFSKGVQNILTKKGGSGGGSTTAFEMIRKSGPENQPANQELRVATLTVPARRAVHARRRRRRGEGRAEHRHQRPPGPGDARHAADAHRRRADRHRPEVLVVDRMAHVGDVDHRHAGRIGEPQGGEVAAEAPIA